MIDHVSTNKPDHVSSIVSQLNKCLKFMTFREGCFAIRNQMKLLTHFLSTLRMSATGRSYTQIFFKVQCAIIQAILS